MTPPNEEAEAMESASNEYEKDLAETGDYSITKTVIQNAGMGFKAGWRARSEWRPVAQTDLGDSCEWCDAGVPGCICPNTLTEKPTFSARFDSQAAATKWHELRFHPDAGTPWESALDLAKWQHAKDAEEIGRLKDEWDKAHQVVESQVFDKIELREKIVKLEEENQRLTRELKLAKEYQLSLEAALRNDLRDNDAFGCEFVYVNICKDRIQRLEKVLQSVREQDQVRGYPTGAEWSLIVTEIQKVSEGEAE